MRLTKTMKQLKQERRMSDLIPITHLNSPSIFETQQGQVGSVIQVAGVPFDTEQNHVLNDTHALWHRIIKSLSDEFGLTVTIHRHRLPTTLAGDFPNAYASSLNERYQQRFQQTSYANDIYLTLLLKGVSDGKVGKSVSWFQRLSNQRNQVARIRFREQQCQRLRQLTSQWLSLLARFKPRLLGTEDDALGHSELCAFLSLLVNGGDKVNLPVTSHAPPLNPGVDGEETVHKRYPEGHLAEYLATRRLFFGHAIQFEESGTQPTTFGTLLTIKHYGTDTSPILFDALLQLEGEFISNHAYFPIPQDVADKTIQRHSARLQNVNDPAVSQLVALEEARDALASQQLTLGHHYHTLLLLSDNLEYLTATIPQAMKAYQRVGFVPLKETIGLEPAFWSQIPGNQKLMARSSLMTSENFAHCCPLHNYRTGYVDGNHLGSAVTVLETPSKTPYYFNYHVKGGQHNFSKGHTMILGGNGAGKTALMCFLDAQASRYQGFTAYFDRDRGAEIYLRASGGGYYILSPEHQDSVSFAPLQLPDTPANRQFNTQLLALLCKTSEETSIPVAVTDDLKRCVDYAYDQLAPEYRTLTDATRLLPLTFPRWPELKQWLRGQDGETDGQYAYLFDNAKDTLSLYQKVGFDMTHFLDNEPPAIRTPVILYLLNRLKARMNGQLVSLYFDEGWQYLRDSYWQAYFEAAMPTYRKLNTHLILATQSPESVVDSPINHVFQNNVATQIYFANPQANANTYVQGLHLTEAEFETVVSHPPESRTFLVKQELDSTLCQLDLGGQLDDLLVLSGNAVSVQQLTTLREQVGEDPAQWLPKLMAWRQTL